MNAGFETIRKELKQFNAEENEAPPKILIAGEKDFLNLGHKRKTNSQFIICVKQFYEIERAIVSKLLDDLTIKTGKKPLVFFYDDENIIRTVIEDFKDYYNTAISDYVFQRIGSA